MKQTESLFEVLKRVIGRNDKDDVAELQWGEYNDGSKVLDFDPCGDIPIDDSRWVLKEATDDEARFILNDFVGNKTYCGWSLNCQMARLLSERGLLIAKKMNKIIDGNITFTKYGFHRNIHVFNHGLQCFFIVLIVVFLHC